MGAVVHGAHRAGNSFDWQFDANTSYEQLQVMAADFIANAKNIGLKIVQLIIGDDDPETPKPIDKVTKKLRDWITSTYAGSSNPIVAEAQTGHQYHFHIQTTPPPLPNTLLATTLGGDITSPPSQADLDNELGAAVAEWQDVFSQAGMTAPAALGAVTVALGDSPDATLAWTVDNTIWIDRDAAGHGWFVDPTPTNSEEFISLGNGQDWRVSPDDIPAADHIDLLTALLHELGHVAGLGHSNTPTSVMVFQLPQGTRRLPKVADVVAPKPIVATSIAAPSAAVAASPVSPAEPLRLVASAGQLTNGDFTAGTQGWMLAGNVAVENGMAVLREDHRFLTSLSQTFTVPDTSRILRFTLNGLQMASDGGNPVDAFEIAVLDAGTGAPVATATGLSRTDALINIQADGRVFAAANVTVSPLSADRPVTIAIDLGSLAAGSALTLSFDLIGFGATDSVVRVDDITFAAANSAPIAVDDNAVVAEDGSVIIAVLANDTDAEHDALTPELLTGPAHGSVTQDAEGRFTYRPVADFNGSDSFAYRVSDGNLVSQSATVWLHITPVNDAPILQPVANATLPEGAVYSHQLSASDVDGDPIAFLLTGGPAGASINATTGLLTWTATDGTATYAFTVSARDPSGAQADQAFSVTVTDVAPTLSAKGAATVVAGQPYVLSLSASDPGTDTITAWSIDWGDGVQVLPGTPPTATHIFAKSGTYAIKASATNEDGTFAAPPVTVQVSPPVLSVVSFAPSATGFTIRFNHAFDVSTISMIMITGTPDGCGIFDINTCDPRPGCQQQPDVSLVGRLGGSVAGSVVIDADCSGFTFIKTGDLLAPDHYVVTLASGPTAFHDAQGGLDGDGNGIAGGTFTASFDQAAPKAGIISLPDFMTAPGHVVELPGAACGLPVRFTSSGGVKNLTFTLDFDPSLLTITGATAGTDLPKGAKIEFAIQAGPHGLAQARITITATKAIASGTVELLRLTAKVPGTARYGATEIIRLAVVSINNAPAAVAADNALQVVGYLGDADRDGHCTARDVLDILRVATKLDNGFSAWSTVDPRIIGDVNGSGTITLLDALCLAIDPKRGPCDTPTPHASPEPTRDCDAGSVRSLPPSANRQDSPKNVPGSIVVTGATAQTIHGITPAALQGAAPLPGGNLPSGQDVPRIEFEHTPLIEALSRPLPKTETKGQRGDCGLG
jgi:Bacterial Ig domain/PKD domain/Cohesin domain/Matrixin